MLYEPEVLNGTDEQALQESFLNGLQRLIQRMTSLKEMLEVYTLTSWAGHCQWGTSRNTRTYSLDADRWSALTRECRMRLYDRLPTEMQKEELLIDPCLPTTSKHFSGWNLPKLRFVFGFKKY